ncbi:5-formyltetrahydrofolate cyclo-ligase-like protein [Leptotrombidium deliense]|uniref:5-formyltetrahydrofolate cyclo-ligase n=1 Tax=Leptotrombidium deliense TaxID=299467 RepID=A0A443S3P5_9ACAR|nr:5-formyltetrahydrofolate cyclo-ligase-like protein [Leptotrombidium deliense]
MASNVVLAKKALRKDITKILLGMSDEQRIAQSKIVFEKILKHDRFINSNRVSIFLSIDNEVNTIPILEAMFKMSKTCFVPTYDKIMKMVQLHSMQDYASLPVTKWNIKQPNDDGRNEALETGGLDLLIVPGVAFNKRCQRLGHGGGFYDRYIRQCRTISPKAYTIAVCFKEQIVDEIPTNDHDEVVDEIVFADDVKH